MGPERLTRDFFTRPSPEVARDLIGVILHRRTDDGLVSGVIVETEAYGGADDLASHAALYPRSRASIMASDPGTAYVYRSYGIHNCFNIVSKQVGEVGAVLIRAVEPRDGVELMRSRRGAHVDRDLCRGPGRLCQAFSITPADTLTDVVARDDLWLEASMGIPRITSSPRVGISRAVDVPWRFIAEGSPFVSTARVPST